MGDENGRSNGELIALAMEQDESKFRLGLLTMMSSIDKKVEKACGNMVTHDQLETHCADIHSKIVPSTTFHPPAVLVKWGKLSITAQHFRDAVIVLATAALILLVAARLGWVPSKHLTDRVEVGVMEKINDASRN